MHPDLLCALARQHHADLLERRSGPHPEGFTSTHPPPERRLMDRVRHSLGVVFVAAGQRLLQTTSATTDLSDVRH
jgi:hypothetical protein